MDYFLYFYNIILVLIYGLLMFLYFQLFFSKRRPLHLWTALLFFVYLADELYYSSLEFIITLPVFYQKFPVINTLFRLGINLILLICYRMILASILQMAPPKIEWIFMIFYSIYRLGVSFMPFLSLIPLWGSVCLAILNFLPHIWMVYISFRFADHDHTHFSSAICTLVRLAVILWLLLCFGCSYPFYFGDPSGNRMVFIEIISAFATFFAVWHLVSISRSEKEKSTAPGLSEADLEALFAAQYKLTPREMEIFRYLMEGADNAEISEKAVISQSTTKTHIYNIFRKVDIKRRSQAAGKFQEFCKDYILSDKCHPSRGDRY